MSNGRKIIDGLREAVDYATGVDTRAKVRVVRPRNTIRGLLAVISGGRPEDRPAAASPDHE